MIEKNGARPLDETPKILLANLLFAIRRLFRGDRFENLYSAVSEEIQKIPDLKQVDIEMLDYGCGKMEFATRLYDQKIIKKFIGADIFPKPKMYSDEDGVRWENYIQIEKGTVKNINGKFHLTIITDVLHHASIKDQENILCGLSKISNYILVKDHFEYGFISRQLLRLADWYGNYAYGVEIPRRYFSIKSWSKLLESLGMREKKLVIGVKIHNGLFGLIIPPRYHFISLIECQ